MSSASQDPAKSQLVSLADEEAVKEILGTTIQGLWEIVNNLARLRPSHRERTASPSSARPARDLEHSSTTR